MTDRPIPVILTVLVDGERQEFCGLRCHGLSVWGSDCQAFPTQRGTARKLGRRRHHSKLRAVRCKHCLDAEQAAKEPDENRDRA